MIDFLKACRSNRPQTEKGSPNTEKINSVKKYRVVSKPDFGPIHREKFSKFDLIKREISQVILKKIIISLLKDN